MAAAYLRIVSIWTVWAGQELSSGLAEFIATPDVHARPDDVGKGDAALQPWQRSRSFSLGKLAASGKPPGRKQVTHAEKIIAEARSLGFGGSGIVDSASASARLVQK
jgi:hypothetical protein